MSREIEILREVVVKVTKLLAGQSIQVTQRGAQAYAKADKTGKPYLVNIPFIPDTATPGFIAAIQGFIDHEVGHILFTDWSVQKKIRGDQKLHNCWNIVEDPFIERMMSKKFPGTAYNLDKVYGYFIEHITAPALAKAETEMQEFGVLLVPVIRALVGPGRVRSLAHDQQALRPPARPDLPRKDEADDACPSAEAEVEQRGPGGRPRDVRDPAPAEARRAACTAARLPPRPPSDEPKGGGEGEPEDDKPAPGTSEEEKEHEPEDEGSEPKTEDEEPGEGAAAAKDEPEEEKPEDDEAEEPAGPGLVHDRRRRAARG